MSRVKIVKALSKMHSQKALTDWEFDDALDWLYQECGGLDYVADEIWQAVFARKTLVIKNHKDLIQRMKAVADAY